jgi:hypothetical protein
MDIYGWRMSQLPDVSWFVNAVTLCVKNQFEVFYKVLMLRWNIFMCEHSMLLILKSPIFKNPLSNSAYEVKV